MPARKLPVMNSGETYAEFCEGLPEERLPMGYSTKDLKKIVLPFQQMYALSVYFGNPAGVRPVIENLIYAGRHNNSDLLVMRRASESVFDTEFQRSVTEGYPGKVELIESSEEGLRRLDDILIDEITNRNVFRDEYSAANNIPLSENGRARKAAKYIRARTKPLIILLESFGDFCRLEKDETMVAEISALISKTRGYNIYFIGCFYPNEEGNINNNPLLKCFNKEELYLLFGGQYDKWILPGLPMDYKRIDKINPLYDRYLLKYKGEYYTLQMPCGELNGNIEDPDEASII